MCRNRQAERPVSTASTTGMLQAITPTTASTTVTTVATPVAAPTWTSL